MDHPELDEIHPRLGLRRRRRCHGRCVHRGLLLHLYRRRRGRRCRRRQIDRFQIREHDRRSGLRGRHDLLVTAGADGLPNRLCRLRLRAGLRSLPAAGRYTTLRSVIHPLLIRASLTLNSISRSLERIARPLDAERNVAIERRTPRERHPKCGQRQSSRQL